MYVDFRDRNTVFSGVFARYPAAMTVVYEAGPSGCSGELVAAPTSTCSASARPGECSRPPTTNPGGHPVAVVSYGYWLRRFGGAPGVSSARSASTATRSPSSAWRRRASTARRSARPVLFVPLMMKAQMTPTWDDLETGAAAGCR